MVRTHRDPLAAGTHRVLCTMIWDTLRALTPVWVLRASLILLLEYWAFGKIQALESGLATSSRERRSAATPSQDSTIAASTMSAAPNM